MKEHDYVMKGLGIALLLATVGLLIVSTFFVYHLLIPEKLTDLRSYVSGGSTIHFSEPVISLEFGAHQPVQFISLDGKDPLETQEYLKNLPFGWVGPLHVYYGEGISGDWKIDCQEDVFVSIQGQSNLVVTVTNRSVADYFLALILGIIIVFLTYLSINIIRDN